MAMSNRLKIEQEQCGILRFRLAVLGEGLVGKTAILRRFLKDDFRESYQETVEDLHSKLYEVNGTLLQAEIVDTAGKLNFPAMRRICVSSAQAFLLVYSITELSSFEEISEIFAQIKELRADFRSVPVVIAGNKADLPDHREVFVQQVEAWMHKAARDCNICSYEVSARTGYHVREIFEALIRMSRLLEVQAAATKHRAAGRRLSLQPGFSINAFARSSSHRTSSDSATPSGSPPSSRKISLPGTGGSKTPSPIRRNLGWHQPRSRWSSDNEDKTEKTECFVQ